MTDPYDDLDDAPKLPLKVRDDAGQDVTSISEAVHANLRRAAAELSSASTPQEQVTLLTAMTLMKQLIGILENPPEIESWSDVQRIHKMIRETLDMDSRSTAKGGADFAILNNFKPTKGKTIDVDFPEKPEPARIKDPSISPKKAKSKKGQLRSRID